MIVRKNNIAENWIGVGDSPEDMVRRDRRTEAKDRLLVSRFKSLVARGGIVRQNGKSILWISGAYRNKAA